MPHTRLEFENCHGLLIADNVVRGMWGAGIDVKNGCNRVLVESNRVADCENASIAVREGDGVKNACHEICIRGNSISGHGTLHYNEPTGARGAIRVGECFVSQVEHNIVHGYQTTAAIVCLGPGAYQARWYAKNPHQASLVVVGNSVVFKNDSFALESQIQFDAKTLGAILVSGLYDSVRCADNEISSDRYLAMDHRLNAGPAICLQYLIAKESCYPSSALVSNNQVSKWGNWGIVVMGQVGTQPSGLTVSGNAIAALAGGGGIHLSNTNSVVCSGNTINRVRAAGGLYGIWLQGSAASPVRGAVLSGNQVQGSPADGGEALEFGIRLDFCGECNVANNAVRTDSTAGAVGVFDPCGDLVFHGTTGFPRSGPASPNGTVASYHPGEMYRDITGRAWWIASSGASTVWTKI